MLYQDSVARKCAKVWNLNNSTISRWKKKGIIPDKYVALPLNAADRATEEALVRLIEARWLKARQISLLISDEGRRQSKVSTLVLGRREPANLIYHVRNLSSLEVRQVRELLNGLRTKVADVLMRADKMPAGQPHSNSLQADLRALLSKEVVNTANIRSGMNKQQMGRFWSFVRGRNGSREDIDVIFARLTPFYELLILPE